MQQLQLCVLFLKMESSICEHFPAEYYFHSVPTHNKVSQYVKKKYIFLFLIGHVSLDKTLTIGENQNLFLLDLHL